MLDVQVPPKVAMSLILLDNSYSVKRNDARYSYYVAQFYMYRDCITSVLNKVKVLLESSQIL